MAKRTEKETPRYNSIPKQVSRKDLIAISCHIYRNASKVRNRNSPSIRYSNYILYVLHTGIQWNQLRTRRNELHWSNVYKWHHRWSKDGSYEKLFEASVIHLLDTDQLDTSRLHGDGSNTVVK